MKQALHIFKKDVRYLAREICLVLALTLAYALVWTHVRLNRWMVEALLTIAAGYLIARLIHAEAIPGDNHFWLTRPYRWKCLLGAKLLFILVFVNLPIVAARAIVLVAGGFPLLSSMPGLVWSQILIILCVELPIAALAAVTTGIVPFVFSTLILLVLGFVAQEMMVAPSLPSVRLLLGPVQWVWDSMAVVALVIIALTVLYVQYRRRGTSFSVAFGISVAALATGAYLYVPWPLGLAVQTRLSKHAVDTSSIQVAIDPGSKRILRIGKVQRIQLDLPLAVTGVPDRIEVQADALTVAFQGSDGRTWNSGPYNFPGLSKNFARTDTNIFNGTVMIDPAWFEQEREATVTLRGSLYLLLFGNSRSKIIPIQTTPVNALDGLQCLSPMGTLNDVVCASPIRWPARLVYARFAATGTEPFAPQRISYSPFPAGLSLEPIEAEYVSAPESADKVTIITKELIQNFRRDFEAHVRLSDLAADTR